MKKMRRKRWYFDANYRSLIFYCLDQRSREAILSTIKEMAGYEVRIVDLDDYLLAEFYLEFQSVQERRMQVKEIVETFLNNLKMLGEE